MAAPTVGGTVRALLNRGVTNISAIRGGISRQFGPASRAASDQNIAMKSGVALARRTTAAALLALVHALAAGQSAPQGAPLAAPQSTSQSAPGPVSTPPQPPSGLDLGLEEQVRALALNGGQK